MKSTLYEMLIKGQQSVMNNLIDQEIEEALSDQKQQLIEKLEGMKKSGDGRKNPTRRVAFKREGDRCYQCGADISGHSTRAIYCFDCSQERSKKSSKGDYNQAIQDIIKLLQEEEYEI